MDPIAFIILSPFILLFKVVERFIINLIPILFLLILLFLKVLVKIICGVMGMLKQCVLKVLRVLYPNRDVKSHPNL